MHRAVSTTVCVLVLLAAGAASAQDDAARIVSITWDPPALISGGAVSVTVQTTPDVVSLEAVAASRHIPIPQVEPGKYVGTGQVPHFPRFIRGHFHVRFIGKTASGETVATDSTIQLN